MAQHQYQVEPMKCRCATTGTVLEEGDEFYTVLIEDGESFRRADYSLSAWTGPPDGAYCYFRSRVPVKEKRRKLLVDDAVLMNLFERLADEVIPVRIQFRFVLALILMRKRLLKYEASELADGVEVWTMVTRRDHTRHSVVNPRLTDDQIEGVSGELSAILHGDTVQWVEEFEPATDDPAEDVADGETPGACESQPPDAPAET